MLYDPAAAPVTADKLRLIPTLPISTDYPAAFHVIPDTQSPYPMGGGLVGIQIDVSPGSDSGGNGEFLGMAIYANGNNSASVTALTLGSVTGGAVNQAIKTGAGDIVFGTLSGTGTRLVTADTSGKLGDTLVGSVGLLKSESKTFNNAEIKALPTNSPVELVPLVADTILLPVGFSMDSTLTAIYTNIAGSAALLTEINGVGGGMTTIVAGFHGTTQAILGTESVVDASWTMGMYAVPKANAVGKSIVLLATNSFTGTIATLTPSGLAVGASTYDIPVSMAKSNTGSGVGATFHIVNGAGSYMVTVPTDVSKGSGFAEMDVIVIDGGDIGGVTVVNDLTITIDTVSTRNEDFTGGNAANSLTVTVYYVEVPAP